jgi:hypothetical protein
MDCKDCAESESGQPAQACCPQCLEEQRISMEERMARDEPEETFEHRRASAAFKGHGVKYDTGKRRFYGDEATALADHLELSGALSLLKYRDKRISELEAALEDILTYVEKYTRMANTEPWRLQRARDALAKETR